jgi:hypothetical protein
MCLSQPLANEPCERDLRLNGIGSRVLCILLISYTLWIYGLLGLAVTYTTMPAFYLVRRTPRARRKASTCAGYPRSPLPFPYYHTRLFPCLPWNTASLSVGHWEQERESNLGLAGVLRTEAWNDFGASARDIQEPAAYPVGSWHSCSSLLDIIGAHPCACACRHLSRVLARCRRVLQP